MVVRKLVSVACVVVMLAALGFAQGASTGDLHITVRDSKGGVVTNASVTARDETKGLERATSENAEGQYHILLLPPGQYTVSVRAPGFATAEVKNVAITVGQQAEIPITLSVAGTQEVVDVTSAAELVETQRTSSTDTIDQRRIDNLPINGRNYINFALTDSRLARDTAPSIGAAPTSGLNMSGQRRGPTWSTWMAPTRWTIPPMAFAPQFHRKGSRNFRSSPTDMRPSTDAHPAEW